ncbi:MAG: aminopeptidase P family protein [Phycisphaerales bacterium]|nr:MAG: aminopeptidase P family protein [Phycisphaerales bacterium]
MVKKRTRKPSAVIAERIHRCRAEMAKNKLWAYLLTNRPDHYYLAGFSGEDSALLVTRKAVWVISDGRFEESIRKECPWATVTLRKGQLAAEIGMVCKRLRLKAVGVQTDHLSIDEHAAIRKAAKPTRLVKAPPIVNTMRLCKDQADLRALAEAIRVAEEAFKATRRSIRAGQTEQEIAARLEYEMARRGSTGPAFPSIVAEGPNAALPHAVPGRRKVRRGSAILFDWGATVGFYRSDLTRVAFVGTIPPKIRKIYDVVLQAQVKAIEAIRPGERMCDIDAVAREHIAQAGYGKQFGHGLGHGLGLDVHEPPALSWRSDQKLQQGMVVTVEPGIYLPGVGGVRIEDDVLVTAKGCKVLSHLRKDIASAVVR